MFNPFLASVLFPWTSSSFYHFPLGLSHSSLMLRFSRLKFSRSSSDLESCAAVASSGSFDFRTSFNVLATRASSYWNSAGCFLETWNRTQPDPLSRAVGQVDLMVLDCACTTLHEFVSCTSPCRGYKCRFLFSFLFLFFCYHPLPRVLRPGMNLCSASTW